VGVSSTIAFSDGSAAKTLQPTRVPSDLPARNTRDASTRLSARACLTTSVISVTSASRFGDGMPFFGSAAQ